MQDSPWIFFIQMTESHGENLALNRGLGILTATKQGHQRTFQMTKKGICNNLPHASLFVHAASLPDLRSLQLNQQDNKHQPKRAVKNDKFDEDESSFKKKNTQRRWQWK